MVLSEAIKLSSENSVPDVEQLYELLTSEFPEVTKNYCHCCPDYVTKSISYFGQKTNQGGAELEDSSQLPNLYSAKKCYLG